MFDEIIVLTFDDIWKHLFKLTKKIEDANFTPEVIVGIMRGGLAVSRILSDLLNIKEVATLAVGFYKGINETEKKPTLTQELHYDIKGKKILLVDDVSDSGRSLEFTVDYLSNRDYKELKTATIHYKPHSIFKPDFFIEETPKWIVYPWEYREFTELFIAKQEEQDLSLDEIKKKLSALSLPKEIIEKISKKRK